MGQKGQKSLPEVADGHHGGLGRAQEGENGLDAGETFWNFDFCKLDIWFFIILLL